ncbi:leucine-rich repeat domain-containing protein [bacterium]|nr:leucine-rich repeat domain-containing protein [bacterium]
MAWLTYPVAAGQLGDFTYSDDGEVITITDFNDFATGSVVIPETIVGKPVTGIATWAFGGCNSVTAISIPASMENIGINAFGYCTGLNSLSVATSNPNYCSENGVLFNKVQSTLIRVPCAKSGSYAIPGTVTRIEAGAFRFCVGLASVTIPPGVTDIGGEAFFNCNQMTEVTIPSTVRSIGDDAFYNCVKVSTLTIHEGLVAIGSFAFYRCSSLTELVIPDSVRSIGTYAFSGCRGLTSLTISANLNTLANSTFSGCSGLTGVTIPNGVTSLGDSAFSDCSGLVAISLPSSLTRLGNAIFSRCTKLAAVIIPSNVASIGENAFSQCDRLISITVDPANPSFSDLGGVLFDKPKSTLIRYPAARSGDYTVPSSVSVMGDYAFSSCRGLAAVTVSPATTRIGKYAFSSCTGLTLTSFPQGLIRIENNAFASCLGLKNLTIPSTVTTLGESAFANCSALESVSILSSSPSIGWMAFRDCVKLSRMAFAGNAPSVDSNFAKSPLPDLKVYYFNGKSGFTSPTWFGYPAINMGDETPLKMWLVSRSQLFDAEITADADGDGVNLLMAYALNLDPNQNLGRSLPAALLSPDQMSLRFYSGSVGISYVVESSSDLIHWSRNGVTLSAPDANQVCTATVNRSSPQHFMRLVVSQ